jgi:hypothetical protein
VPGNADPNENTIRTPESQPTKTATYMTTIPRFVLFKIVGF